MHVNCNDCKKQPSTHVNGFSKAGVEQVRNLCNLSNKVLQLRADEKL